MERPIWQGHISFGLVNIPVLLFSGERKNDLHFKLIDSRDHARIRYERVNEDTGKEVPWSSIAKAYELNKGDYVVLQEKDFEKAKLEPLKTIEIEDFIDNKELECLYFEKPYYLVPGKGGEKGYVLLREILEQTNRIGIAKIIIRTRAHIAALMPQKNALLLNILRYPQEIRKLTEFQLPTKEIKNYKISKKELDIAEQLVDAMTVAWDPSRYHDDYREILMKWIEEKTKSKGKKKTTESDKSKKIVKSKVIDFMTLLKKSIKEKKPKTVPKKTKKKSRG